MYAAFAMFTPALGVNTTGARDGETCATPASARALSLAPGAFLYLLVTSKSSGLAAEEETSA